MKGTTPQWQHFSLQTCADAFWRLLNCTWYRQASFSFKSKTDCFSQGRELLDKRSNKAGTVQPSGGWCMKGVSLWIVRVCVSFAVFSFVHACMSQDCVCAHVFQMPAHAGDITRPNRWSWQAHVNLFSLTFFHSSSYVNTSLYPSFPSPSLSLPLRCPFSREVYSTNMLSHISL